MLGMLLEAQQHRDEARRAYEAVLALQPTAGVAANNLAWLYADDGRLDDALRLALVAKQALGRASQARDTLAWIYLKKRQPREAIPLLAECLDAQPENPTYRYHLALAYRDTAHLEQPARHWRWRSRRLSRLPRAQTPCSCSSSWAEHPDTGRAPECTCVL
jgi:Flp pilus assembly protein TadD